MGVFRDDGADMPNVDSLPFTVLVPETAASPIEVYDQHAALRMAIVERPGAHLIAGEWDVPGVYVLLDPVTPDGRWGAYVGKAPAGIATRLRNHLKTKDHWSRALLVRRDTTYGFNSAQIGYLEGRLYDLLQAAELAELSNSQRPGDETVPPYDRQVLDGAVIPISRLLRLVGYDPSTGDDELPSAQSRSSRFHGITVADLVHGGLIAEGAHVVSTNGAWPATGRVLGDGSIETEHGVFDRPSRAAMAAKDGGAANGWEFWAVETPSGPVPLATLRVRYLDLREAGAKTERAPRVSSVDSD